MQETESLVAHVLAIKWILTVMMRSSLVDGAAVGDVVKEKTSEASGDVDGSPKVRAVVESLLSGIQSCSTVRFGCAERVVPRTDAKKARSDLFSGGWGFSLFYAGGAIFEFRNLADGIEGWIG
jgi:hypothetical protein